MRIFIFILLCALGFAMYPASSAAQSSCSRYALQFDGTNDAVELDGFATSDEMTIEFWFYPGSTDAQAIFSSLDDDSYSGFRLYQDDFGDGPYWFISMESDEGVTGSFGFQDVGSAWYHVAIIF